MAKAPLPPAPKGHRRIGAAGADHLTVDQSDRLYWKGVRLKTDLGLSPIQRVFAALAVIATLVAGVASTFESWVNLRREKYIPVSEAVTASNLLIAKFSVRFGIGQTAPLPSSRPSLDAAFDVLRDNAQSSAVVHAYTDISGTADVNAAVARARAANVRQFLAARGIEPERLSVEVHAADDPRADNTTVRGRQQNRRVEIEIQSPLVPLTS